MFGGCNARRWNASNACAPVPPAAAAACPPPPLPLPAQLAAAEEASGPQAIAQLREIVTGPAPNDAECLKVKEAALNKLADALVAAKDAPALRSLLTDLRPLFGAIPKAKTAKIVRTIIDSIARVPGSQQLLVRRWGTRLPCCGQAGRRRAEDGQGMWVCQARLGSTCCQARLLQSLLDRSPATGCHITPLASTRLLTLGRHPMLPAKGPNTLAAGARGSAREEHPAQAVSPASPARQPLPPPLLPMLCLQLEVCREQVEWATSEKRTFLRQRIEIRLAQLQMDLKEYPAALQLIGGSPGPSPHAACL